MTRGQAVTQPGKQLFSSDRQLLGELLGIFLADCPGHLQALRSAVAGTDPAALMRAAHTLSGSLRVLGAAAATGLVGQLEALGREGRLEGAAALLTRLEPELELMRDAAVAAMAVSGANDGRASAPGPGQ